MSGPLNLIAKPIAFGIGLTAEVLAARKQAKANEAARVHSTEEHASSSKEVHPEDHNEHGDFVDCDYKEWALDDVQAEIIGPPPAYTETAEEPSPGHAEDITKFFLAKHRSELGSKPRPLPCPVILPQRRPKDKSRGFVRAYSPILEECSGINQNTFMDFLETLDKSSKASPIFDVINLACFAVGMIPEPTAMAVSIAVTVANKTAQEVQTRSRTNNFIEQVNKAFFMPHGLFVMIMTYKPDNPYDPFLTTNLHSLDTALSRSLNIPDDKIRQTLRHLQTSSGTTKGEFDLPECAPLIYPYLDAAATHALETSTPLPPAKQNALKSSAAFLQNYLDRRAQAQWAGSNPSSKLASPPPDQHFASRFSDPNHPANSGTLWGLLTGGTYDPEADKRVYRAQQDAARRGIRLSEQDLWNIRMGRINSNERGLHVVIKKVLQKNVLYLAVVNLPSEEEVARNLREFEKLGAGVGMQQGDDNYDGEKDREAGFGPEQYGEYYGGEMERGVESGPGQQGEYYGDEMGRGAGYGPGQ